VLADDGVERGIRVQLHRAGFQPPPGAARHGIAGVRGQIEQHRAQAIRVDHRGARLARRHALDQDGWPHRIAQRRDEVRLRFRQVDPRRASPLLAADGRHSGSTRRSRAGRCF
jgi:hypothetical protein